MLVVVDDRKATTAETRWPMAAAVTSNGGDDVQKPVSMMSRTATTTDSNDPLRLRIMLNMDSTINGLHEHNNNVT